MMARAATRKCTGAPMPSTRSSTKATGTNKNIQCRSHPTGFIGMPLAMRASGVASEVASEREIQVHALHALLALHTQQRKRAQERPRGGAHGGNTVLRVGSLNSSGSMGSTHR